MNLFQADMHLLFLRDGERIRLCLCMTPLGLENIPAQTLWRMMQNREIALDATSRNVLREMMGRGRPLSGEVTLRVLPGFNKSVFSREVLCLTHRTVEFLDRPTNDDG